MDIGLNGENDVFLSHRNDVKLLKGREAFEQALRLQVTDYFYEVIGEGSTAVIQSLIQVQARRVAKNMNMIDSLKQISVKESSSQTNTIEILVVYKTAEEFSFSLSE